MAKPGDELHRGAPQQDRPTQSVKIETQSPRAIQAELVLRMDGVIHSIQSLERAQQITQECLQLEVSV
jgi:hypothetical protein